MGRCPYCTYTFDIGEEINNCGDSFFILYDKYKEVATLAASNKSFYIMKIKYCPLCGRKLAKEPTMQTINDYLYALCGNGTNLRTMTAYRMHLITFEMISDGRMS